MPTCYKLTDQMLCTHGGYQWALGEWRETDGTGNLCGPGWLHAYSNPLLALLINPVHADIKSPRLWRAEGDGQTRDDRGLKLGFTRLRIIEEMPLPTITNEQRVMFAIRCAIEAGADDPDWMAWALHYIDGSDRTKEAAAWVAREWAAAWAAAAPAEAAAAAVAWAAAAEEAAALVAREWAAQAAAEAAAWAAPINLVAIAQWAVKQK